MKRFEPINTFVQSGDLSKYAETDETSNRLTRLNFGTPWRCWWFGCLDQRFQTIEGRRPTKLFSFFHSLAPELFKPSAFAGTLRHYSGCRIANRAFASTRLSSIFLYYLWLKASTRQVWQDERFQPNNLRTSPHPPFHVTVRPGGIYLLLIDADAIVEVFQ